MNQEEIWNNIAPEWNKFKTTPAHHVLDFLKKKKGKILDLGSGSGRHLKKIRNGKMYLVDFSKKMIELAEENAKKKKIINAEFFVAKAEKLPFDDNFFDYAVAVAVFHCLTPSEQKKAVKELFRVLKKGGEAEIAVWNKDTKWFRNSPKERYVGWREKGKRYYYLFEPNEVYDLFEKAGFRIIYKEEPQRNIIFIVKKP